MRSVGTENMFTDNVRLENVSPSLVLPRICRSFLKLNKKNDSSKFLGKWMQPIDTPQDQSKLVRYQNFDAWIGATFKN